MAVMARERRLAIPRERVRGPDWRGMGGKAIVYAVLIVAAVRRPLRAGDPGGRRRHLAHGGALGDVVHQDGRERGTSAGR